MPGSQMPDELVIHADPSKSFFIDMLTRDISLAECVLDLVDNSLHSLIRDTDLDVMQVLLGKKVARKPSDAKISIRFDSSEFRIEDTCGGITIEEAANEVFRFGKVKPDRAHTGLGVYGIGMKRAVFKLGRMIAVESSTDQEEFLVEIDVD